MAEAVIVAVRCRPFNKREIEMGSKLIVEMGGPKTTLNDPKGADPPREFTFDYSYWSHDSKSPHFATNPKVYADLGVSVLNNAWTGYNCCLFAYGQTGSGKSYSMVGYGEDKGIVPLAMEEMFKRISANKDPHTKYMVEASMMEIYNEKVRDLYNPTNPANSLGLKVRDHPQTGPYVEDLCRCAVKSWPELEHLMAEGTAVRTVAATQMNATSSRAHTVFQIIFTTTVHDVETNKSSSKTSRINLVDLAGSERISKTGVTGQQLKEGIGINKSLTALGDCIEKLAKKSAAKKGAKEVHVPYRNSVLTWLLKESLGGNAKTIMIAAISPADDNYDESLSTLRYADRAKQIKNAAVVNEDENAKIIRQLKEEINRLKAQLGTGGAAAAAGGDGMTDAEREEYLQLKEQMKQNEELVKSLNMSWEEKLKETEALAAQRALALGTTNDVSEKKKKMPHMVNLHKDKLMSECLTYFFPPGIIRLCTKTAATPPGPDDIILSGLQIKPEHAKAENRDNKVVLTPEADARVFVNGKLIKDPTELNHNDRVICGAHLVFRVIFPNHAADDADSQFDWDFAQKEMAAQTMEILSKPDDETIKRQQEQERKMKELEEKMEAEKRAAREDQERKQREYEERLKEIARKKEQEMLEARKQIEAAKSAEAEKEMRRKLQEREQELERERQAAAKAHSKALEEMRKEAAALEAKLQAQREETEKLAKKHETEKRDRQLLEENLMHVIPMINEANAICTELAQPLRFSIKLQAHRATDGTGFTERTDIFIRVLDLEDETEVMWEVEILQEHLYMMREIYNQWLQTGTIDIPRDRNSNPFYVQPSGPTLIGQARLYLQPIFFLLPINESTAIIDYRGEHQGQLYVNLIPIPPRDEETAHVPEEDLFFAEEDLGELKGEPLQLRLEVKKCMGLPEKYSNNVYVQYRFFYDHMDMKTDPFKEETINPLIEYKRDLLIDMVEDEFVEYIKTGILEFSVYGEPPADSDDEDEDDSSSSSSKSGGKKLGKASKKEKSERLARLEQLFEELHHTLEEDPEVAGKVDPALLLNSPVKTKPVAPMPKDAPPEVVVNKVKEIVKTKTELKEEVIHLATAPKPAAKRTASIIAIQDENSTLKKELEALRIAAASAAMADEHERLKQELETVKAELAAQQQQQQHKAGPEGEKEAQHAAAVPAPAPAEGSPEAQAIREENESLKREVEKLHAQLSSGAAAATAADASSSDGNESLRLENDRLKKELEEAQQQLASSSSSAESSAAASEEVARLKAEVDAKAAELNKVQETQQQEALTARKTQEDIERLKKELESAKFKIGPDGVLTKEKQKSEEENKQLLAKLAQKEKELEDLKKSKACVIL